jgi:4-diphosphocytidyl-2-methyl-D-erithritol synthase
MTPETEVTNAALIVAAGRGSRMAADTPKQYLTLGTRAVLHHTVNAF